MSRNCTTTASWLLGCLLLVRHVVQMSTRQKRQVWYRVLYPMPCNYDISSFLLWLPSASYQYGNGSRLWSKLLLHGRGLHWVACRHYVQSCRRLGPSPRAEMSTVCDRATAPQAVRRQPEPGRCWEFLHHGELQEVLARAQVLEQWVFDEQIYLVAEGAGWAALGTGRGVAAGKGPGVQW